MVAACQRDEPRAWNATCEPPSLVEGHAGIIFRMHDKGRGGDHGKQRCYVRVTIREEIASGIFGRG
jgi:hypothetical protein